MAGRTLSTAVILFTVLLVALGGTVQAESAVKIWEEPLILPTYEVAEPDSDPMFFKGEVYQGASKVIYPYPFLDKLGDLKEDKSYRAVYLENEYIKVSFLPEMGGRLFSALDKTNNYDFFYRQEVIKPALIGMLGAWISGGIEWCVLHHHRASTYMPVDYTLVENPDGSKTLWFGETELRQRMKWIIGATLYPGKSYLQITGRIYNRTPFSWSFLYWANVAVHADDDYQVIFPPSVEYATYHAKNEFTHWPVGRGTYRGVDYTGVELSWWKNHPEPVSFFAWDLKEDFSGGYDHGKEAGVIHIGNHHIVTGAKLWEWSPGPRGKMWDKILADNAKPYTELMVGAFSDNQPDYSWIKPYEVKTFTQYWYPVREIGGFKNANLNAAVNLELTDEHKVKFGFNATSQFMGAQAVLKAGDKLLYAEKIYVGPDKPFVKEVNTPEGVEESDLEAILYSRDKQTIISYKPVKKPYNPELPPVVQPPPTPKDVKTIEQLYLTGQRIEQFYNPTVDAYPYYEEALKRDPCDSRVNTAIGIDYNKRAMYAEAEKRLRTAVERIGKNYTRPRNCEPYYQLGLALRAQGQNDRACDNFYRASWDYAFHSPAYYQLAELSCIKTDFTRALEQIDYSISTNTLNNQARDLRTAILRKLGRLDEARRLASGVLAADPLDFLAANELYLIENAADNRSRAHKVLDELMTKMQDQTQSYLELSVDYLDFGLYDDSIDVLQRAVKRNRKPLSTYPMVYYYLGYLHQKKTDRGGAMKYYAAASKMPPDFCFPFRAESIDVLTSAVKANPNDARAYYYLGNLLYDKQPERAIAAWEKSRDLDGTFATVHRNLGWAYYRCENNIQKAVSSYEKAISCNSRDARVYAELDKLYEAGGVSPKKRLALLEPNLQVVRQRNDSFLRLIMVLVQLGSYDQAVEYLATNHFHLREGGGQTHDVYVDAHLLRGAEKFKRGDYSSALADYLAAGEYPENLEVGRPRNDKRAPQVNYFIATSYEASGDKNRAEDYYKKAAEQQETGDWPETRYYQALALAKLGKTVRAKAMFDKLIETGQTKLTEKPAMSFFAKFGERQTKQSRMANAHYILALGHLGSGQNQKAKDELQMAVKLNPNQLWAKTQLTKLQQPQ